MKFYKYFHCNECDNKWTDIWDSLCNDRCPTCSTEIEPYAFVELPNELHLWSKVTLSSTHFCQEITVCLVGVCSATFSVEPMPGDVWEITFKPDHLPTIKEWVGNHLDVYPKEHAIFTEIYA